VGKFRGKNPWQNRVAKSLAKIEWQNPSQNSVAKFGSKFRWQNSPFFIENFSEIFHFQKLFF
jgi:hypothetical protein